jgi:hypothetical protein
MAKNINDVAPVIPLFEKHEQVKKDEIKDKAIVVLAYSVLESDDGEYGVMAFKLGDKLQSCTINVIMLDRLREVVNKIGLNEARSTEKEKYLSEAVEVKIIEKESTKNANRTYFVFE